MMFNQIFTKLCLYFLIKKSIFNLDFLYKKCSEKERCVMNIVGNSSFISLPKFNKMQNPTLTSTNPSNDKSINMELDKIAAINKSQVNFRGKGFDFNKKDLIFLSGLTSVFGLSVTVADKLKDKLAEFLQSNKLESMDDMAGEENLLTQSNLIENLNEVTNFEGKDYFKLMDKVLDRCDPQGKVPSDDFSEEKGLVESLMDEEDNDDNDDIFDLRLIKDAIEQIKQNDKKCLDTIAYALEFNNAQKTKLTNIVNQTLKSYGLSSLKELANDDMWEKGEALVQKIVDEFRLSEDDKILIDTSLTNRTLAKESNYSPFASPLDRNFELSMRDFGLLEKITKKNNISLENMKNLQIAMKIDAYNNGFESIFDLFRGTNDISKYKNVNQVLNSEKFASKKIDLLIDLNLTARNLQNEIDNMKSDENKLLLNNDRITAFICELDKLYNFSKDEMKALSWYMKTDAQFDFSNAKNAGKIAYELSEHLKKENDFKDLSNLVKQVCEMQEDDLDSYGFKYCQLLMRK